MYLPDAFKMTDATAIRSVMNENPFANFATNGPDGPAISHLPLVLRDEDDDLVLYGHFSRANPHWKMLDGSTRALAVFAGEHGYISPGYYPTKQATGKVVPTWNYVVIHARGVPQRLDHGPDSRDALDQLTDSMEQPRSQPWKVADAPDAYTETMMRGIVAFRMVVDTLEAKAKLSQNKPDADIMGACDGLVADGSTELADRMRAAAPPVDAKR